VAVWTDPELDVLFRDHLPTEPTAPTLDESEAIARELGTHTAAAVQSDWGDGRSIVLGHPIGPLRRLRSYIARRGWT
jgi:hypothetical protein